MGSLSFFLAGCWCGRKADGQQGNRLQVGWQVEQCQNLLGVEVANPAGAQPQVGGLEGEVIYRDGHVDVAMILAILWTFPTGAVIAAHDDHLRGCVEPFARIGLLHLLEEFLVIHYDE